MKVVRDILNCLLLPVELMYLRKKLKMFRNSSEKLKNISLDKKQVLVISPHSDDEMLGLGGFIAETSGNIEFHVLIPTVSSVGNTRLRLNESKKAFSEFKGCVNVVPGEFSDGRLF